MKSTPTKFSPSSLPIEDRLPRDNERLLVLKTIGTRVETAKLLRMIAANLEAGGDGETYIQNDDKLIANVKTYKPRQDTGDINQEVQGRTTKSFPKSKYVFQTG